MKDQYEQHELIEQVTDLIADEKPVDAIVAIAAAFEVDLYDLEADWQRAVDDAAS